MPKSVFGFLLGNGAETFLTNPPETPAERDDVAGLRPDDHPHLVCPVAIHHVSAQQAARSRRCGPVSDGVSLMLHRYPFETHVAAWTLGAVFVALSVPLSLQDIHMHILHYISPLQRHYIRILWMVPIYAVESWLALRFNEQKVYLETLREAYEAFVVYSLYKLMREFMGDKPMVRIAHSLIPSWTTLKTLSTADASVLKCEHVCPSYVCLCVCRPSRSWRVSRRKRAQTVQQCSSPCAGPTLGAWMLNSSPAHP